MLFLSLITNFIIDEWLYSVSWGSYHIPISIFIMLFLFKFIIGIRMIQAVFLTLFSNITSLILFSVFAMTVAHINSYSYAQTPQELCHPLLIAIALGLIYASIQSLLFCIISRKYTLPLGSIVIVTFLSNMITALCIYALPAG